MRTVTLEEHFTTPEVLAATAALRENTPPGMAALQPKLLDLGDDPGVSPEHSRLAAMDEGGITQQVLSLTETPLDKLPAETATPLVRDLNDRLAAAVRAHPDRLAGWAALNLLDPAEAARELERATGTLGFPGAMVSGTVAGAFLDDARFAPFWEAANALRAPIYLHPALPPAPVKDAYYSGLPGDAGFFLSMAGWGWHSETALHTLRLIVAGVFDRYPELRLIIGHMGEGLPYFLARSNQVLGRAAKHIRQEPAAYFRENIYITTSGFFTPEPFVCAKAVLGLDRMLYSVDYPYSPNTRGQEFLQKLALGEDERAALTHGTADKLLGLSERAPLASS